jgi:outer membrane protein
VDLNKAYSEFKMTKELDAKLTLTEQNRKNILDSLKFKFELVTRQLNNDMKNTELQKQYSMIREEYSLRQQQLTTDQDEQTKQYNDQIFKQINQYVQDYRKEKGYDIVLGASGNGAVMSADEKFDITSDMVNYMNEKYQGKK